MNGRYPTGMKARALSDLRHVQDLADAGEILKRASEATVAARAALGELFLSIADDVADQNGHHPRPAQLDLYSRLVKQLQHDDADASALVESFAAFIVAKRAHRDASDAYLTAINQSGSSRGATVQS